MPLMMTLPNTTVASLSALLLTASLLVMAGSSSAHARCATQEHAQVAAPVAQLFISSPEEIRAGIAKEAANNPMVADFKPMLEQQAISLNGNPKYQQGLIHMICKHFAVESLAGVDANTDRETLDAMIAPKLPAIKKDLAALQNSILKAGQ